MIALRGSLFKVTLNAPHLVGDLGKTDDVSGCCLSKSIEGGCFHLNTENPFRLTIGDRLLCFSKWSICCQVGPRITRPSRRSKVWSNKVESLGSSLLYGAGGR